MGTWERADTMRHVLDTMRTLSMRLLGQARFGANASDVLLLCAVAVGHLEAKPMGAMKVAAYCGIPRPTCMRRLGVLQRAGLVERDRHKRYTLTVKALRRLEAWQDGRVGRLVGVGRVRA